MAATTSTTPPTNDAPTVANVVDVVAAVSGAIDVLEPSVFWEVRFSVAADPELLACINDLRAGMTVAAAAAANDRAQAHVRASRLGATGGAKVEKDFIALMNKLSVQNHSAIEAQLWRFFQPLLFTFYTNHLWSLMYRQPTFNALYMGVLRQVHDRIGEDDRAKLKAVMRSHFDAVFRGFGASLAPMVLPAGEDYDEFCDAVKLKKQSIGKVAALCAAIKAGLLEDTPAEVVRRLTVEVPATAEPEKVSIWTEHVQAALTELDWSPDDAATGGKLRAAVDRMGAQSLPPKARFRVLDLAERLRVGGGAATNAPRQSAPAPSPPAGPARAHPPSSRRQAPPHHHPSPSTSGGGGGGGGGRSGGGGGGGAPQGQGNNAGGAAGGGAAAANAGGDWREAKRKGGRR